MAKLEHATGGVWCLLPWLAVGSGGEGLRNETASPPVGVVKKEENNRGDQNGKKDENKIEELKMVKNRKTEPKR